MPLQLADRLDELGTETAYTVSQEAAAMQAANPQARVFPMHIGDLNFKPEPALVKALNDAIDACRTGYCAQQGIAPLRAAIAERMGKDRGIAYTADNVSVQPGGKFVIAKFLSCVLNPKEEVLLPSPGYPIYHSQVLFLGGIPVDYGFKPHPTIPGGLTLDLDSVRSKITSRTKVLIINDFHNPTGYVLTPHERTELAKIAVENDLWVLADEAYWDLIWEPPAKGKIPAAVSPDLPPEEVDGAVAAAAAACSGGGSGGGAKGGTELDIQVFTATGGEPAGVDEAHTFESVAANRVSMAALPGMQHRTVILMTCSKSWAMTGWRLGAAVGPKHVIDSIHRLNVNYEGCTTHFVQWAAIPCFSDPDGAATDYLRTLRAALLERRDALVPLVQSVPGLYTVPAASTFYCYVEASTAFEIVGYVKYEAFRRRLLADTGVSFTTREHFGQSGPLEGSKYIRFAYSGIGVGVIETAMRALGAYLRGRLAARASAHRIFSFVTVDDHLLDHVPTASIVQYDTYTFGPVSLKAPPGSGGTVDAGSGTDSAFSPGSAAASLTPADLAAKWDEAVVAAAEAALPPTSRPATPKPAVVSVVDLSEPPVMPTGGDAAGTSSPDAGAAIAKPQSDAAAVFSPLPASDLRGEKNAILCGAHHTGVRRAAALMRDAMTVVVADNMSLPRVVFTESATPELKRVAVISGSMSKVAATTTPTAHALSKECEVVLKERGVEIVFTSETQLPHMIAQSA